MSAWRACLSTLAVMGGEPPFIIPDRKRSWRHVECGSARSRTFRFWPVASASNELTHFKRRHSCLRLKSTPKIKCNREFYGEMGKVKGRRGGQVSPACRAAISHRAEGMSSIGHAHKPSQSTRCKCACMRGNTNTSSTYNRASIIASLLESGGGGGLEKKIT